MRSSTCSGSPRSHVERVLHRARRMAGREVQRLEVVPVELDLGTFGDLVAEADEHVLELALALGDQVQVTPPPAVAAEGEVERRLVGAGRCELGPRGPRAPRRRRP